MNRIGALAILILMSACGSNPDRDNNKENPFKDSEIQNIYRLGNERNTIDLIPYAESKVPAHRMAFSRIMASSQDTMAFDALLKLVKDPIPYVRLYAVHALGQYRDTLALESLEKAIKKATIPEIKSEVLEAIGKCSNSRAMDYLIFHEPSNEIEETGKMRGIYEGMLRGHLQEKHLRIVIAHLRSGNPDTRLAAAHTLSRQKEFELHEYANDLKTALEQESVGEIRAVLLKACRALSGLESLTQMMAQNDPDSRVRSVAVSMLANSDSLTQKIILDALDDGSVWVAMAASKKVNLLNPDSHLEELKSIALRTSVPEVRAEILNYSIRHSGLDPEFWLGIHKKSQNLVEIAAILKSFGSNPLTLDTLLRYLPNDDPTGSAAAEALIQGAQSFETWEEQIAGAASESFQRNLPAQSFHFAYAFASGLFSEAAYSALETMEQSLSGFDEISEIETRNEIKRAISELRETEFIPEKITSTRSIDFDLLSALPESQKAIVYTQYGTLKLSLLPFDAPSTVSSFISLCEEGFYDGTFFHRIVPVFVSQGGGDRGDGFGGPGYAIRSEFSPLQFGEGVFGMASAGKDTEGSQFFVTHISTPHLNGRYTIFAGLTDGFEVLNSIHTGTLIDSIRVEN
jgi:cyclophilin family peptidyl-prolyl cis-trans isomerase/HEAT repeat protein